jgi:hypothetical protein
MSNDLRKRNGEARFKDQAALRSFQPPFLGTKQASPPRGGQTICFNSQVNQIHLGCPIGWHRHPTIPRSPPQTRSLLSNAKHRKRH